MRSHSYVIINYLLPLLTKKYFIPQLYIKVKWRLQKLTIYYAITYKICTWVFRKHMIALKIFLDNHILSSTIVRDPTNYTLDRRKLLRRFRRPSVCCNHDSKFKFDLNISYSCSSHIAVSHNLDSSSRISR